MNHSSPAPLDSSGDRATSYDQVLYPSYVHAQSHPDRLNVLATLFAMNPAPVRSARVLELACGQGGNLIPIATGFPNCHCLGIDLSDRQIAAGNHVIAVLGLDNIELRTQSILDFPDDAETFDYIIAHGVFSWVPEAVRDKILQICQTHLAPQGVAFVSYNTFPGWHQRRMIRDMMRFHTKSFSDPAKRIEQAKAFLMFMTKAVTDDSAYGKSLHEEFRSLSDVDEAYLFHEQLEEVNEPMYFHEFAALADRHRLQYVCEVELSSLQMERYPPQVADALRSMDIIEREQYCDFLTRRTFRQTVLCHANVSLDRTDMLQRAKGLRIASPVAARDATGNSGAVDPAAPVVLQGIGGVTITVGDALTKSALAMMAAVWPRGIAFDDLQSSVRRELSRGNLVVQSRDRFQRESDALADHLLKMFVAGLVEFRTVEPDFTPEISERPIACPLARYQAESGNRVTTRFHKSVTLDPLGREVLRHLDGNHGGGELLEVLVQFVDQQSISLQHEGREVSDVAEICEVLRQTLEVNLRTLGRHALLIARENIDEHTNPIAE